MAGFKLGKDLACRANPCFSRVFEALTDAFFGVGARGNVEQALVGLGVLDDGRGLAIHRKHHGAFALLEMLDEVAGRAAEGREGLDVGSNVEHGASRTSTLFGAFRITHVAKVGRVSCAFPGPEGGTWGIQIE